MRTTRARRLALGARSSWVVVAALALATAGCGGSGSKATPIVGSTGSPATTAPSGVAGNPTKSQKPATGASTPATTSSNAAKNAELAALEQQLSAAGSLISASGSAVSGSDVNAAKAQEGSAP